MGRVRGGEGPARLVASDAGHDQPVLHVAASRVQGRRLRGHTREPTRPPSITELNLRLSDERIDAATGDRLKADDHLRRVDASAQRIESHANGVDSFADDARRSRWAVRAVSQGAR